MDRDAAWHEREKSPPDVKVSPISVHMSMFFQDPNEVKLPPEEVRLKSVQVVPTNSTGRVKVLIELTPFQKRPNVEVSINAPSGKEAAHAVILDTLLPKLEVNMHIREFEQGLEYRVETRVYYQRLPEATTQPVELPLPEPMQVDQQVISFMFPKQTA
jgi:hypothetical protein